MGMNLEKERDDIIRRIKKLDNEATIIELKRVLDTEAQSVHPELLEAIKEAREQVKLGEVISHDEVKKTKYPSWFGK